MKILYLFSTLCLSFNTLAWSERGNGGNSIICEDPSQNKFYDAYEAEFRYGLKPVFPNPKKTCDHEIICFNQSIRLAEVLIDRIPDHDFGLKEFMHFRLRSFGDEAIFLDNIILMPIDDMGTAFIPTNCKLHQTVIQRRPLFPGDKRYIISNDQWKKLSPNHQAVGIVHELLYNYAVYMKHTSKNSEGIRYFNALLVSNQISKLSKRQYVDLYNLIFADNTNHHE